ncbi:MBL fold metallo-hydrolase [Spirosoma utsteinense]|uniref:L-ascorbate metabolism protein UlaG (Beta-lactamase superfamily) n=1 Tax=Spirosoma utsteinense TaxID=2585773 RepID=A0ABR6W8Y3_9BACT|nr:MBL fold metallo-hydrolase [Spirosoma utsteinense]MBC3786182.1 L-ascorbate metabolism protein UlaG (beta-lactamase superfamily) [Spirosoma utsteinense]MBC3792372.1 L-ascorbate metabolism protein UlaG (beta-lactamase superfamily) [Spirosoma utsteinense]
MLKPAFQKDEALLADIEKAVQAPDKLHVWWLGQSGFLLQYAGRRLLVDPYLSDSLPRKYAVTDKPHVRVSELVIDPSQLDMIDVVTSSHNHTDHLDADTLLPLIAANPAVQFVIPEANRAFVSDRLHTDPAWPLGLTDGGTVTVGDIVIHGVPAAHNERERDEWGFDKFMGFVFELGPYTVYHSGDTLWYDGMVDVLRPFPVDVAFLPINGNKPERRVAGNLDPDEAARLGRDIGAKLVIPHHYDLFAFNTADPADFVRACERYGTPYRVMQLGEGITLPNPASGPAGPW